jgi:hypothetical protein
MSVRLLHEDWLYDNTALVVFPEKNSIIFGPYFNSYLVSYLLRLLGQSLTFNGCYVEALPVPPNDPFMEVLGLNCISLKQELVAFDVVEYKFDDTSINYSCPEISNLHTKNAFYMLSYLEICASLHAIEGLINYIIFLLLDISDQDRTLVYNETGTPAGCHPMIYGHESLPSYLEKFAQQKYMLNFLKNRTVLSITELSKVRLHLRALFEAGPGAIKDTLNNKLVEYQCQDEFDEELDIGAQILIPPETFLEEISQKLKIHPISVHWLLKEGIEKDGWRCIPEEQRITKDKFTVIILRLLGHRWLWQIDAGEIVPDWADKDGVIPLKEGSGEKTLLERVHERIAEEFPGGRVQDLEREFEEIMEISLEKWLAGPFFKHHISQFRKRPIAWQIESNPPNGGGRGRKARQAPVFSCLVYYHRLDGDLLHKIRTQYVWNLRDCFQTELRTLENMDSPSNDQLERLGNLRRWIEELKDFDARLEQVSLNGFNCAKLKEIIDQEPLDKWTSRDGQAAPPATKEEFYLQEKRYDPDINDGVRVNIAPLQIAGLLSADVLAKKDLEKAIQDRAEWRADERRWCRQGKLPRPGWWKVDGQ